MPEKQLIKLESRDDVVSAYAYLMTTCQTPEEMSRIAVAFRHGEHSVTWLSHKDLDMFHAIKTKVRVLTQKGRDG